MEGLSDKVIIVAGSSSGIGAATARKLAADGAKVVAADINGAGAHAIAESIQAAGGVAIAHAFDIAEEASVRNLIQSAVEAFGGLDGLHNNAADLRLEVCGADTDVVNIDLSVWQRTFEVNLTGYLLTMRYAIPEMLKRGGGAIVNTSSVAAIIGEPVRPAYGASKAGVCALTRHVASAYGKQRIRCNAVLPGVVRTEGAEGIIRGAGSDPAEFYDNARDSRMNSHRYGLPDDVASMVALLLSDEGSWVNGQSISVDGGWRCW